MVSESKTLMEQADSLVVRIDEVQKAGLEYHVSWHYPWWIMHKGTGHLWYLSNPRILTWCISIHLPLSLSCPEPMLCHLQIAHSGNIVIISLVLRPLSSLFWVGLLSPNGSPPLCPVRRIPLHWLQAVPCHLTWSSATSDVVPPTLTLVHLWTLFLSFFTPFSLHGQTTSTCASSIRCRSPPLRLSSSDPHLTACQPDTPHTSSSSFSSLLISSDDCFHSLQDNLSYLLTKDGLKGKRLSKVRPLILFIFGLNLSPMC